MNTPVMIIAIVCILISAAVAVALRKLTVAGGITGFFVALFTFLGTGWLGLLLLGLFFVCGTLATAWKKNEKNVLRHESTARTAGQVLANGGVAGLLGIVSLLASGHFPAGLVMTAGSLAAAASDTLSSELGMVYGTRHYNILTFKKDSRGLNGVVSAEGTLAGVAGAALVAFPFIVCGYSITYFVSVFIAGITGNLADSYLGATLERRGVLGNDAVNFLNTVTGAGTSVLIYLA